MHQGGYMESKSVFRDRKQLDVAGAPHQVQMFHNDGSAKRHNASCRGKNRRFPRLTVKSTLGPTLLQKSEIEESRKSRGSRWLRRCNALQDRYDSLWSFLCETMWSLTSLREGRTSGPETFVRQSKRTFSTLSDPRRTSDQCERGTSLGEVQRSYETGRQLSIPELHQFCWR
jgi:hypothetical protein